MSSPPAHAPARRLSFLDGLRGIAIIFMVFNHTGRWWMDASMGWGRYWLVYGTVLLPAPIFLFLVGFCLPLSHHAGEGGYGALVAHYARRGATIIGAGLLLNVIVFPEDPWWSGGVLQTIGLSIVLLGFVLPFIGSRGVRYGLATLAVAGYTTFVLAFPILTKWIPRHPLAAQIWFFDFPPWAWVNVALLGLVLGQAWIAARARGEEAHFFRVVALAGVACLAMYFAWDSWFGTTPRFGFKRDLLLNRHWTPRGATDFVVVGGVALLLSGTWWVMEVRRWALPWLVVLGQTAFMLYFVHQLIALSLVNQVLGLRFNGWLAYTTANVVLIAALVGLGMAWLVVKRAARRVAPRPVPAA